jgi:HD superfamily phosphohydrolase
MLRVHQDELVVEEKGMYSIEKFLLARRLMYWSVYLHKTSYVAEEVLKRIILCARELLQNGDTIQASADILYFLSATRSSRLELDMRHYAAIDDVDVLSMIKVGVNHHDPVYSALCEMVLNRRLPKIEVSNEPFSPDFIEKQKDKAVSKLGISAQEVSYFVFDGKMKNMAYNLEQSPIILIDKNGGAKELLAGSDESNLKMLTKAVTKYYCCYPK